MRILPSLFTGLVLALALAACPSKQTPAPSDPDPDPVVDNSGGTPADGECVADEDCVVSCMQQDNCCSQLCPPCEQVYTKAELAALEEWVSNSCAAVSCPVAKCMAPDHENVARCQDGQCVVEAAPIPTGA